MKDFTNKEEELLKRDGLYLYPGDNGEQILSPEPPRKPGLFERFKNWFFRELVLK